MRVFVNWQNGQRIGVILYDEGWGGKMKKMKNRVLDSSLHPLRFPPLPYLSMNLSLSIFLSFVKWKYQSYVKRNRMERRFNFSFR